MSGSVVWTVDSAGTLGDAAVTACVLALSVQFRMTLPPSFSANAMPPIEPSTSTVFTGAPLPRPLTALIARERDLALVASQLNDPSVRLLTLTGPGGVGKTRLAIAAAAQSAPAFPDGIVFVDLSQLGDSELVLDTIAGAFGLRDLGAESLGDRLPATIDNHRLLLVIDNFEHVVTAAPRLIPLLERCSRLTMLVTSRIRLRLSGEREFSVAPLSIEASIGSELVPNSGGLQLFIDRARDMMPDFPQDAATLKIVEEIVRRVDGLPLAIELAAARSRALPPAELLKRMEQRLPLLSGGARDLPLRQQTMRDTIGWSYDLLDDDQQAIFRRLGVFAGGFTLDAAEALAGRGSQRAPLDVIDGITTLIEHSLLRQLPGPSGSTRYQMLETVREYARDRSNELGEWDSMRRLHAEFFLAIAETNEPKLIGPDQVQGLDAIECEHDNLRAALAWSLQRDEHELATRLGAALWLFWRRRGYLGEGRAALARILALPPNPAMHAHRCSMLTGAGALALLQADYVEAIQHSEAALIGWRQIDGQRGLGRSLLSLAIVARHRDDYARAEAVGRESLAAFESIDDRWGIGRVLCHLGMLAWVQGDHAVGSDYYEHALAHLRAAGDPPGMVEVLLELGKGASDAGDSARAIALFDECLVLADSIGDLNGRSAALNELGVVALHQNDLSRARDLFQRAAILTLSIGDRRQAAYLAMRLGEVAILTGEIREAAVQSAKALELFLAMGNRVGIAQGITSIAQCAEMRNRAVSATRLYASAAALFEAIGAAPPPRRDPTRAAESLATRMDRLAFAEGWEAGLALRPADAASEALALADELAKEEVAEAPRDEPDGVGQPSPAAVLGLTPREIDVLRLLGDGLSDREIADALSISERTAGNHVQHAMQKIGVSSRTAAAVYAVRNGLL